MLAAHRPHRLTPASLRRSGAVRALALAGVALAFLTSCKVDARVEVRVGDNGSGVVAARFVLDEEAAGALGEDVAAALRLDDLADAGWDVEVEPDDGGGAEVVAEKGFARPADLAGVVDELSGPAGPFRDFRLAREASTLRTSFAFGGVVDLEPGVGATLIDPADPVIVAEAQRRELEVGELRDYLAEQLDDVLEIEVVVSLPGGETHNAPGTRGGAPAWAPQAGERVEIEATSSTFELDRVVLIAMGVALAGAAAVTLLRWRALRRREARRSPAR